MTFSNVPLQIVGQYYKHRNLSASAQTCTNLFPQVLQSGASESALFGWPGADTKAEGVGAPRGITVHNNVLYQVAGTTLYSVDAAYNRTTIGTISGTNRCLFSSDGTNLIITNGSTRYQYNGTTLSTFSGASNSSAYINNQIVFDSVGQEFEVADVGDPDTIAADADELAFAKPDDATRVEEFRNQLLVFGPESIQPYFNSGEGATGFTAIQNGVSTIGLSAIHSVAQTDQFVYFLDSNSDVSRMSAYQPQKISTVPISKEFASADTSDAIGYTIRLEGEWYFILTSANLGKTFAYCESNNSWFQLSSGNVDPSGDRYFGTGYVEVYGKHVFESRQAGALCELDFDTFTDDGLIKVYERVTAPITGSQLRRPGERIIMDGVNLEMETGGTTFATGDDADPTAYFSVSTDGGQSWTNDDNVDIGRTGEGGKKIRWNRMKSGYSLMVRIRFYDQVRLGLYSAGIDVDFDGY